MNPNTVLKLIVAAACTLLLFLCAILEYKLPGIKLGTVEAVGLAGLTATGVWHAATTPGADPNQGGFALPAVLILVMLTAIGVCVFAGCTTTTAGLYAGVESATVKGIKATDDNLVVTLKAVVCGLPYSAVQRDPTMSAAVDVLCGPLPRSTGAVLATMSAADMAAVLQLARSLNAPPPAK